LYQFQPLLKSLFSNAAFDFFSDLRDITPPVYEKSLFRVSSFHGFIP